MALRLLPLRGTNARIVGVPLICPSSGGIAPCSVSQYATLTWLRNFCPSSSHFGLSIWQYPHPWRQMLTIQRNGELSSSLMFFEVRGTIVEVNGLLADAAASSAAAAATRIVADACEKRCVL